MRYLKVLALLGICLGVGLFSASNANAQRWAIGVGHRPRLLRPRARLHLWLLRLLSLRLRSLRLLWALTGSQAASSSAPDPGFTATDMATTAADMATVAVDTTAAADMAITVVAATARGFDRGYRGGDFHGSNGYRGGGNFHGSNSFHGGGGGSHGESRSHGGGRH